MWQRHGATRRWGDITQSSSPRLLDCLLEHPSSRIAGSVEAATAMARGQHGGGGVGKVGCTVEVEYGRQAAQWRRSTMNRFLLASRRRDALT
jgi:hypothetical protein